MWSNMCLVDIGYGVGSHESTAILHCPDTSISMSNGRLKYGKTRMIAIFRAFLSCSKDLMN